MATTGLVHGLSLVSLAVTRCLDDARLVGFVPKPRVSVQLGRESEHQVGWEPVAGGGGADSRNTFQARFCPERRAESRERERKTERERVTWDSQDESLKEGRL